MQIRTLQIYFSSEPIHCFERIAHRGWRCVHLSAQRKMDPGRRKERGRGAGGDLESPSPWEPRRGERPCHPETINPSTLILPGFAIRFCCFPSPQMKKVSFKPLSSCLPAHSDVFARLLVRRWVHRSCQVSLPK